MTKTSKVKLMQQALVAALFIAGCARAEEPKPNVVFIMLDDLGYSQIEAYARGLGVDDCDPKLLDHVGQKGNYAVAASKVWSFSRRPASLVVATSQTMV